MVSRLGKLHALAKKNGFDNAVLSSENDIFYYTGFRPGSKAVLILKPTPKLFLNPLDNEGVKAKGVKVAFPKKFEEISRVMKKSKSIAFDEMVGIYHIVEEFGGEISYLIFQLNEDGSFMYGVDFNYEFQAVEEPHITGEWWIEDGVFHIVDKEIKADFGVGWECQIGAEGTYEVIKLKDNRIAFKRIEDPCVVDESGDGITSRYMILVFSPYKIGPPPQPTSTPTPT